VKKIVEKAMDSDDGGDDEFELIIQSKKKSRQ
jgi:hypothetical protein